MTTGSNVSIWLIFAACLITSFLLSGMEAGVFALSRLRIRQQLRAGRPSARVLHHFLENPENFLWTILVANTLTNFVIWGWLVVVLHRSLHNHPLLFAILFAVLVLLFFTFFDLLPKTIFRLYPNRLCLLMARPFKVLHWLLRPLVVVVESVSTILLRWRGGKTFTGRLFGNREELRLLMQETAQSFTTEEKAMINRVLDFQSLTVRSAMRPMSQVVSTNANTTVQEALELCRKHNHTRMPVWAERERRRQVIGLVSCNWLLYEPNVNLARAVSDYLKPAIYIDEDIRLEIALQRLQRSGQRLAIVLGRDRRESGIITLEDVLRVIFGEVHL